MHYNFRRHGGITSHVHPSRVTSGKKRWSDGCLVAGQQFEYGFDDIGNREFNKAGGNSSGANLRTTPYHANLLNPNVWNGENRRTLIESRPNLPAAAKARVQWTHLPDGRWVERIVSTNNGSGYFPAYTNRYVWDGNVLLAVLDAANDLELSFLRGLDLSGTMQGAGGVGGLLFICHVPSAISHHAVAYDGNGNVVALVDAADGTQSARYEYGPFAEPLRLTGPMAKLNPIRFSTQYADDVTGDTKYLYRDYRADLGSWISRDPIGERGGANLSGFVDNSPVNEVDAFGLQAAQLPSSPTASPPSSSEQSACDRFGKWYEQEKVDLAYAPNWLSTLPDCPCNLTMSCRPKHQSPKAKEQDWSPVPKPLKGWRFDELVVFHPGARWCMRSHVSVSRSSQQCCYDHNGKLITHGLGAGTPDRRARGYGHGGADADPFTDALKCDGGTAGESVGKYLEVRPPNKGNGCDQNPP